MGRFFLLALILMVAAIPAVAQPTLSSTTPANNARNVARSADLSAAFSQNMSAATSTTFTVRRSKSRNVGGSYAGQNTSTLSFNPTNDFLPGEIVRATLTNGLTNTSTQGLSNPKTFSFRVAAGVGPGYFSDAKVELPVSNQSANAIALADFDGDGDLDIAIANANSQNRIYFQHMGNFAATGTFGSGFDNTYSIDAADVDGDGDLDLICGNFGASDLVYFNNGAGGFASSGTIGGAGTNTVAIKAGDFDNDGDLDVVAVYHGQQGRVFPNNGSGSFMTAGAAIGASTRFTKGMDIGDMDGDGDLDVVIVATGNTSALGQNEVYLNTGSGTSFSPSTFGSGTDSTTSVDLGDVDGDGDLDVLVGTGSNSPAILYANSGNGTLTVKHTFTGSASTRAVMLFDGDGDNKLDALLASEAGVDNFFVGDGAGSFGAARAFGTSAKSVAVDCGDMDGDGDLDVVVGIQSVALSNRIHFNEVGNQTLSHTASPSMAHEAIGNVTVTVTRSGSTTGEVSVDYTTGTGTATAGTDYTATSGTLNWGNGDGAAKTFTIAIAEDTDVEQNETIPITLSNASGAMISSSTITLTILDNDTMPDVAFAQTNTDFTEANGSASIQVELTAPYQQNVTVDYATGGGSATAGSDFTATSGTLTFTPGETSKTWDIPVLDDSAQESSESVTLTLSSPNNASLGALTTSTLTILDNDSNGLTLSFAQTSIAVAEDGTTATVTVNLSSSPTSQVTVDYATSNGTATAGSDYTAASGTLTFAIGDATESFDITISDDMVDENDETITITLSNEMGAGLPNPATATLTITDDDASPDVDLTVATLAVAEDIGNAVLTVELSEASGREVTVDYTTGNGTATAATDFTTTQGTVTFGIGETSKTISIPVIDDNADESAEDFSLTLSNSVGATLGTSATTLTINDNDAAPTVAFSVASADHDEDMSPATLTVELSTASGRTVTVDYATTNGSATSGDDFTALSGTLTFMPGQDSKTIDLVLVDDDLYEGDENIRIKLSAPSNATLGTTDELDLTIKDDESMPSVSLTQTAIAVTEGVASVTIDIVLSGKAADMTSVDYSTSAGSATAGNDFTAKSGTLQFAAEDTMESITVDLVDGTIYEPTESFTFVISMPSGVTLGTDTTATITISDDEAQPTLSFANLTPSANEAATTVSLVVTLSAAAQETVSVDFAASAGTATDVDDFTSVSGQSVTFPSGNLSKNVTFDLKEDQLDENDETITLALSSPVVGALGMANATFTILDDDATPSVSLSSATYSENEDGGMVQAQVTLSAASGRALSVDFATSNGTATEPGDYDANNGTLNFAIGETTKSITITLNDDAQIEGSEDFTLTLSNEVNVSIGTISSATITILDDESPPELLFAQAGYSVNEDGASIDVEVKLSKASGLAVSVDFATSDVDASAGQDYTAQSGMLTFAPSEVSKTITIAITDDVLVEANEVFELMLSNPSNATLGSPVVTIITIQEDDQPSLDFTAATLMPNEDAGMVQIDLALSVASFMTITLDVASQDGSAEAGLDYQALAQSITFNPGETTKSVMLTITDDQIDEPNETLSISYLNLVNADMGTQSSVDITIVDDEIPEVAFVVATAQVAESALSLNIGVQLDAASFQDVEVDISSMDFSAFAGSDYTALSESLTIPAGMTSVSTMLTILDDVFIEGDETLTLSLANPVNSQLGLAQMTITITSDDIVPTVSLQPATRMLAEANGQSTLSIELSEAFTSSLSIRIQSQDVTATAGSDYTAIDEVVTFGAGEMIKSFPIEVKDDGAFEGDESFLVVLSMPSGVLLDGNAFSTEVTIQDDDQPTPPAAPSFNELKVLDNDNAYRAGETITIEADLGVAGLMVEADLSVLDSSFSANAVIPYFGSGKYRLTTSALSLATMIEGVEIPVAVRATDSANQSIQGWLAITIDSTPPNGQLLFNAPQGAVPMGDFEITLAFDEPVITVPLISISGLGALSVDQFPMMAAVPSLSFRYTMNVPNGMTGSGIVSITPPQDLAGNIATIPTSQNITLTGGPVVLRANAGGDQVIAAPATLMLDGTNSIGAVGYEWTQIAGPSVAITGAMNAQPTVSLSVAGDYLFRLDVTSAAGMASDSVLVTLLDGAPSVNAGPDIVVAPQEVQVVGPNRFVTSGLNAMVSDPSGDQLFITWEIVSAPANSNVSIVSRNSAASQLQVFGSVIEAGVYEFEIRVQDRNLIARKQFVSDRVRLIVIGDGTRPPTADAGADQVVTLGSLVVLNGGRSSDPDVSGPALNFEWTLLEKPSTSNTSLQGNSNQNTAFSADRAGVYRIGLVVRDADSLSSIMDIVEVWAFDNDNFFPRAGVSQLPEGAVEAGTPVMFDAGLLSRDSGYAGSQDFEGDQLTVEWEFVNGPTNITIADPTSLAQQFTFPNPGNYFFGISVNDGSSDGIAIEHEVIVLPAGRAVPVAVAAIDPNDDRDGDGHVLFVPSLGVDRDLLNREVNLSAIGSSVSAGQTIQYLWRQTGGPAIGIVGATTVSAGFAPSEAGIYDFELRVSDGTVYASAQVRVAIDNHDALENPTGNALPRVTVGSDVEVEPNTAVELSGTGFDPNGGNITLVWQQLTGAPVNFESPSEGVMRFTPVLEGDWSFALYADDGVDQGLPRIVRVKVRSPEDMEPEPSGGGGGGGGGGCALQNGTGSVWWLICAIILGQICFIRRTKALKEES